jgi:hypothetical protein
MPQDDFYYPQISQNGIPSRAASRIITAAGLYFTGLLGALPASN